MINRNYLSGKIFLILLSAVSVSFSGCRLSPVLEQVVYQEDQETDKENETESVENDEENELEDEQLASKTEVDEADSKRDQTRQDALSGDGKDQADKTYDSTYEETAKANGTSSQAPTDRTDSDGNTGTGENEQAGGNGDLNNGDQSGTGYEPSDDEHYKQIVDGRGQTVNVPENVDRVTAVGEIATIVEMLGGSDRLLASSGNFTGNNMAKNAFSSQGFSNIKTWWNGNGSEGISSGSFNELLAAKPDVCFEISGQSSFSSAQVEELEKAKIAYVVLPSLNSIDNIKSAVRIVGDVLGDKSSDGGTNAPAIAQQYSAWADSTIETIKGKGSAKSTIYISAWDDSAFWEIKNSNQNVWKSGYGVAISRKNAGNSPLDDCMKNANLKNEAVDSAYVNPLKNKFWTNYVSGGSGTFTYGLYLTQGLGNETYPAIIVADDSIKTNIQNDIHWQVYGTVTDGFGNTGVGFLDENGNIIGTTIEKEYDIYVNPNGLGSWTEGSVEAPLEAAWLSCKFQNGCSKDELRNMISEFYSTFYHTNVDVGSILGE